MSENKESKKILRPKKDEVNGKFRIFGNEKLGDLWRSSSVRSVKSKRLRWVANASRIGVRMSARKTFVGEALGKR
jgi:hypothetical protein